MQPIERYRPCGITANSYLVLTAAVALAVGAPGPARPCRDFQCGPSQPAAARATSASIHYQRHSYDNPRACFAETLHARRRPDHPAADRANHDNPAPGGQRLEASVGAPRGLGGAAGNPGITDRDSRNVAQAFAAHDALLHRMRDGRAARARPPLETAPARQWVADCRAVDTAIARRVTVAVDLDTAGADQDSAAILNRLGWELQSRGEYELSLTCFERSMVLCRRHWRGLGDLEHALAYRGLARAHHALGDDRRRAYDFGEALKMFRTRFPSQDHPEIATSLGDKAMYYSDRGVYDKAEPLFEQALAMFDRLCGDGDDTAYAYCLGNAAAYYRDRGDTAACERFLTRAHDMRVRLYGDGDHYEMARDLMALGTFRAAHGDSVAAQSMLAGAVAMLRRIFGGGKNLALASAIETLGRFYTDRGNFEDAKLCLEESAEMYRVLCRGIDHPGLAGSLCDRAILYGHHGRFADAGELFDSSLAMFSRLYEKTDDLDHLLDIERIACFEHAFEMYDRADSAFDELAYMLRRVGIQSTRFENEDQQIRFQSRIAHASNALLAYRVSRGDAGKLFEAALATKGRILSAIERRNELLTDIGMDDTAIAGMVREFRHMRRMLSETRLLADSADGDEWERQQEKSASRAEKLEKILAHESAKLGRSRRATTWRAVGRELGKGEIAIELIRVSRTGDGDDRGADYFALVLQSDTAAPALVRLCDERELGAILTHSVDDGRGEDGSYIHDGARGAALYNDVWAPFDSLLRGARRIYICPDGLLNAIPFAALADTSGTMLIDRYDIRYLSSSRDLIPRTSPAGRDTAGCSTAALFGGITYGAAADNALEALAGTLREVDTIGGLLALHGYHLMSYTGMCASEEAFTLLESPTVLHVATHAYFYPRSSQPAMERDRLMRRGGINMIEYSENPLIRSGLFFAGASRAIKLQSPLDGRADGIVTALDIANMNLSHTRLVVLSACETGLGDIDPSEGVFGLKRAFLAAGADAVLMSLWKVPDEATNQLMGLFYRELLEGNAGTADAFNAAQREMARSRDRYYWAGFVLVSRGPEKVSITTRAK